MALQLLFSSRRIAPVFLVGWFLGSAGIVAAEDLRVEQGVWTSGVKNRQYTTEVRSGSAVGELFFWTSLRGGKETLLDLQSQGKLPIIHEWKFASPLRLPPEAVPPVQERDQDDAKLLEVGSIVDLGGLTSTVSEGREFRWRTWSHKQSLWRGTWVVRVLYADGQPVPCPSAPCQWSFFVR